MPPNVCGLQLQDTGTSHIPVIKLKMMCYPYKLNPLLYNSLKGHEYSWQLIWDQAQNKFHIRQNEFHPVATFDTMEVTSVKEAWLESWQILKAYVHLTFWSQIDKTQKT